jgi:hypothetical protein
VCKIEQTTGCQKRTLQDVQVFLEIAVKRKPADNRANDLDAKCWELQPKVIGGCVEEKSRDSGIPSRRYVELMTGVGDGFTFHKER